MNQQSNYSGYQEEPPLAPQQGPRPPLGQYSFSPEEMRVLKQCNNDSFYQRSLPLGTLLGLGAYGAVKSGYLRASQRFGVYPKVTLAVVAGYMLGKLSYQQACAEKLMAIPGSYIGQLLRERQKGPNRGGGEGASGTGMLGARAGDVYSDAGPGSALDLDSHRPLFTDDAHRPLMGEGGGTTVDRGPSTQETAAPVPPPSLTYDELRRRNRGQQATQDPYRVEPPAAGAASPPRPPPAPPAGARPRLNKYGDEMD